MKKIIFVFIIVFAVSILGCSTKSQKIPFKLPKDSLILVTESKNTKKYEKIAEQIAALPPYPIDKIEDYFSSVGELKILPYSCIIVKKPSGEIIMIVSKMGEKNYARIPFGNNKWKTVVFDKKTK